MRDELYKFIYSKLRDDTITEDVLQDVFIKVHLSLYQLKDPSKLTSWVYQIARNTITDYLKQPKFENEVIELAEEEDNEQVYKSLSNCINSKINLLSSVDREAVLLTYFKNYSQKELAAFLGISYSGAKNRIQRVREKLRLSILDCENVQSDTSGRIIDYDKNIE